MTYFIITLAVALVALVGWRLYRLPRALEQKQYPALRLVDPLPPEVTPTGHRVFASAVLEHNEHGFISTPMVDCMDPDCHCRKMFSP